jgi:hypothetical protein
MTGVEYLSPMSPPTSIPHPYKVQVAQELPCYENPWKPLQYVGVPNLSKVDPTPCHKLIHYKLLAKLLYYCTMGHDKLIMDDK